jgi:hypothetical protein
MKARRTIVSVPDRPIPAARRRLQRELINALTTSDSPVILNLAGRRTLDHDDVDLLLDCVAQAAGRDTQIFIVAGSRAVQVLLEVIRISALVPVFNTIEEALSDSANATGSSFAENGDAKESVGHIWSA